MKRFGALTWRFGPASDQYFALRKSAEYFNFKKNFVANASFSYFLFLIFISYKILVME